MDFYGDEPVKLRNGAFGRFIPLEQQPAVREWLAAEARRKAQALARKEAAKKQQKKKVA